MTHPLKNDDWFQIYLRIKPRLTASTTTPPQQDILHKLSQTRVQITSPYYIDNQSRVFDYNEVFTGEVDNVRLFERTMLIPINNVLNGFNSTVLIYGMTGAGKTHTMFGGCQGGGVVFQTVNRLFEVIDEEVEVKTKVTLSFYEIYNENIRDLLKENSGNLHVTEDAVRGVSIAELGERVVEEPAVARGLVLEGLQRRAMNSTKTNDVSSRSHAILQLTIKRLTFATTVNTQPKLTESKLFLVDLAGNQKTFSNYANLNKRFVQGVNINKSLLTLGKCINILAEQRRNQFVPFRDSKLTRILKESLGGNSKTVMIACVSPDRRYYEETLNTLKYSTVARGIRNKTVRNVREVKVEEWGHGDGGGIGGGEGDAVGGVIGEGGRLEELVDEVACAAEDRVKADQLLNNLLIAKSKNNQGSTSESILQDLIFKMQYERDRAQQHLQSTRNALYQYCKQNTSRSSSRLFENATKKLTQYQKIIDKQKNSIKTLKAQNQSLKKELEARDSLARMEKENTVPLVETQRVNSMSRKMISVGIQSKGKSLESKKHDPNVQWSMANLTKVHSKIDEDKDLNLNNLSQTMPKRTPSAERKPKDLIIHLTNTSSSTQKQPALASKDLFLSQLTHAQRNLKDPRTQPLITQLLAQAPHHQLTPSQQALVRKLKFFQEKPLMTVTNQSHQTLRINSSERNLSFKPEIRRSDSRKATSRASFFK